MVVFAATMAVVLPFVTLLHCSVLLVPGVQCVGTTVWVQAQKSGQPLVDAKTTKFVRLLHLTAEPLQPRAHAHYVIIRASELLYQRRKEECRTR